MGWTARTVTVTTTDYLAQQASGSPLVSIEVHTYTPNGGGYSEPNSLDSLQSPIPSESSIVYKDGSGSILRSVQKRWISPKLLSAECTTLDDGSTSGVFYGYPANTVGAFYIDGTPIRVAEYDFGTLGSSCVEPSTPNPSRETDTVYQSFDAPSYSYGYAAILDRPSSVKRYYKGALVAETDYSYDQQSISSVSAINHDDANYSPSRGSRGNVTTVTNKCLGGCTDLVKSYMYDSTGQMVQEAVANVSTSFSYLDSFASGQASGNTNAYLTKITKPVTSGISHTESFRYNLGPGTLQSHVDENGNPTNFLYNDPWNRQTEIDYPDGGVVSTTYNDASPRPSISQFKNLDSSRKIATVTYFNGYGLKTQEQLTSDPAGATTTDYGVDGMGHTISVSNPYRSSPADSTTIQYDALGRKHLQTNPGGWKQQWDYSGPTTTFTDEAAHVWKRTEDGLGRLIQVVEPGSLNTTYTYDGLNNLLYADQWGANPPGSPGTGAVTRSFQYDSLSRLITATNPESGTICYGTFSSNGCSGGYDARGRLLSKTDARGVLTSFHFDDLDRLISKTFSDGTRGQYFGYDGKSDDGSAMAAQWSPNAIGRLSHTSDRASVASSYSYDVMGRLQSKADCLPAKCDYTDQQMAHYDVAGNTIDFTYPDGRKSATDILNGNQRQFGYDALNRLTTAIDFLTNPQGTNQTGYSSGNGGSSGGATGGGTPTPTAPQWTDPDESNALINPDVPGSQGWQVPQEISITAGANAPDGSANAYTITSTTSDGWLSDAAQSNLLVDSNTMTGSVWLRSTSGSSQNINLYLIQSSPYNIQAIRSIVVTPQWQQFQLSGQYAVSYGTALFQIAGAGTLPGGQSLEMWGAKLEDTGHSGRTITNFLPYSQRFGGTSWSPSSGTQISDNTATAPDGTNTAATLIANGSDGYVSEAVLNPGTFAGAVATGSVWLRSSQATVTLPIYLLNSGSSGFTAAGRQLVTVSTNWTRFQVTGSAQTSLSWLALQIGGEGRLSGGATIQVWGAQLEMAAASGPYVATGNGATSVGTNLTNVLSNSSQMNATNWGYAGVQAVINAVSAPDGTKTGMEGTAQTGDSWVTADVLHSTLYDGALVTGSVYLRRPSGSGSINLYFAAENSAGRVYLGQQPVALDANWRRYSIAANLPAGMTRLFFQVGGGGSFQNSQLVDIWGTQIEVAGSPGPYIPTSSLPVLSGQELTNILPSSQVVSGPSWGIANASWNLNSAAAPDGSNSATTITANQGTNDAYAVNYVPNASLYDSSTVTGSIYLRSNAGNQTLNLYLLSGGGDQSFVAPYKQVTLTSAWQRFSLTTTLQNGLTFAALQIGGGGTLNNGQSIQAWGTQLTLGSDPAPYTGTSTTATSPTTQQPTATVPNGMNLQYSYDSFGNLLGYGSFTATYSAKNQMNGWPYDASGNLLTTNFGGAITWDGENRISSVGGANYLYDADGNRVESSGSGVTDTVYFGGRPVARYVNGQWTDLIYGPQGLIAEVAGQENAQPQYRLTDHLGTLVGNLGTANDGSTILVNALDSTPFGQAFSGNTVDPYVFTGKERDTESGLDYFGARYYANTMGRWMSPDPSGLYLADSSNPQSLNLYSYVSNQPTTMVDPNGMLSCGSGGAAPAGANPGVSLISSFLHAIGCAIQTGLGHLSSGSASPSGGGDLDSPGFGGGSSSSLPYHPSVVPRLFGSLRQAGITSSRSAVAATAEHRTNGVEVEFGGHLLLDKSGHFRYTSPITTGTSGHFALSQVAVPFGYKRVGYYHSHPIIPGLSVKSSVGMSLRDAQTAADNSIIGFMGDEKTDTVWVYEPSRGCNSEPCGYPISGPEKDQ